LGDLGEIDDRQGREPAIGRAVLDLHDEFRRAQAAEQRLVQFPARVLRWQSAFHLLKDTAVSGAVYRAWQVIN